MPVARNGSEHGVRAPGTRISCGGRADLDPGSGSDPDHLEGCDRSAETLEFKLWRSFRSGSILDRCMDPLTDQDLAGLGGVAQPGREVHDASDGSVVVS